MENIGEYEFEGMIVCQVRGIYEFLGDFANYLKENGGLPSHILEIGTYKGGFTTMLSKSSLSDEAEIVTLDWKQYFDWNEAFEGTNVDIKQINFLSEERGDFLNKFFSKEGRKIAFCDGGHKTTEFNAVAPLLSSGDIILAHDYATNREVFEQKMRNAIWNWHEISYDEISGSCEKYGLIRFEFTELFENKAWACFIKS